jgi:hypothetical protein
VSGSIVDLTADAKQNSGSDLLDGSRRCGNLFRRPKRGPPTELTASAAPFRQPQVLRKKLGEVVVRAIANPLVPDQAGEWIALGQLSQAAPWLPRRRPMSRRRPSVLRVG